VAFASADSGEDAARLFADGRALLAKADFDGALRAYAAAMQADTENDDYRMEHSVLSRVIKIRAKFDEQKDAEKWAATARSLRAFYYDNDIYSEALALDKRVHARLNTTESAAMLAETQLELGKDADAAALLGGMNDSELTPQARVLLGIAWARQKKLDEARQTAGKLPKADEAGPGLLFDMARLASLTGDLKLAAELLTKCFEATPPSRLEGFKSYAKQCQDLGGLVKTEAFAKALRAESKVPESKCSSGTSCGKCPMRGGCSSGKDAKNKTDGQGSCAHEKKD
jgi:hypothetical protein